MLVMTKHLSRQAYFCYDKHAFAATKMILVAAPANDRVQGCLSCQVGYGTGLSVLSGGVQGCLSCQVGYRVGSDQLKCVR